MFLRGTEQENWTNMGYSIFKKIKNRITSRFERPKFVGFSSNNHGIGANTVSQYLLALVDLGSENAQT